MRSYRADERVSETEVSEQPAEFGEQRETYGGEWALCKGQKGQPHRGPPACRLAPRELPPAQQPSSSSAGVRRFYFVGGGGCVGVSEVPPQPALKPPPLQL